MKFPEAYWTLDAETLLSRLGSTHRGISPRQARRRLSAAQLQGKDWHRADTVIRILLNQFRNPLVLILLAASTLSAFMTDWMEAAMVAILVLLSAALGFTQEFVARRAFERLASSVRAQSMVMRGGRSMTIRCDQVVSGDLIVLSAGDLVPADSVVLESVGLAINESVLTGETYPVSKHLTAKASMAPEEGDSKRPNCLWMGTSVDSGHGIAVAVHTGSDTLLGQMSAEVAAREEQSAFSLSMRRLSIFLVQIMTSVVLTVLVSGLLLGKPLGDMVLFAIALAVGLTPEMLPVIMSVMLSHGARRLAAQRVIVRRLNAIETLGAMTVLCTDKTGTLTYGDVTLQDWVDGDGRHSDDLLRVIYQAVRAREGKADALHRAIVKVAESRFIDLPPLPQCDELPFDFDRRRGSVVLQTGVHNRLLVTSGAMHSVLSVCRFMGATTRILTSEDRRRIAERHQRWADQGYRVIGVAMKDGGADLSAGPLVAESDLCFMGILIYFDPPKPDAGQTIQRLRGRGVGLRMITGDDHRAARHAAERVGIPAERVVIGSELDSMSDLELRLVVSDVSVYAEVSPAQKERLIRALRGGGSIVGYLGDGVNDALALNAADVGISVSNAVDVARESSDFVLLRKELEIICDGIDEGRKTFTNTLTYIRASTSSNFGNMLSMAIMAITLPFLPLLPAQILLNNLLADLPAIGVASDRVAESTRKHPLRMDINSIRNFMIVFGLISVVFDLLIFFVLLHFTVSSVAEMRTAWFVESLLSQLIALVIIRTPLPLWRSRPSTPLAVLLVGVAIAAMGLPYVLWAEPFAFTPLALPLMGVVVGLVVLYALTLEGAKRFYRW